MSKGVRFIEASEQDLRNELKNMREENARIIKKEECSQALIKKLHDDFKAVKEDIKNSLQLKEENKSLKEEIAKRKLSSGGNQHPETQNLKNKIAEHRLTETRLRATLELMSTQLVEEDIKNKQLVSGLEEMNKEIERQGKNEKERSMLYDKTKEAFIKMWNVRRNKTKTSKVSGENVRKDIKSLLTELWVDIPERDTENESLLLAQAQDSIVCLVEKSKNIFNVLAAKQSLEDKEEEFTITVKRKRGNPTPSYQMTSSFSQAQEFTPALIQIDIPDQMNFNVEESVSDDTDEISRNVSRFLAEIRESSNKE